MGRGRHRGEVVLVFFSLPGFWLRVVVERAVQRRWGVGVVDWIWGTGPGAYDTPAGDRGPQHSLGSRPSGGRVARDTPGVLWEGGEGLFGFGCGT